jgi:hypothetical protein
VEVNSHAFFTSGLNAGGKLSSRFTCGASEGGTHMHTYTNWEVGGTTCGRERIKPRMTYYITMSANIQEHKHKYYVILCLCSPLTLRWAFRMAVVDTAVTILPRRGGGGTRFKKRLRTGRSRVYP